MIAEKMLEFLCNYIIIQEVDEYFLKERGYDANKLIERQVALREEFLEQYKKC